MKLRNKKTGEIMELECITIFDRPDEYNIGDAIDEFYTLSELNEEWEDYEESKKGWYLDGIGKPIKIVFGDDGFIQALEAIGSYFETKEEAEKAIEKLKAWKRLKDKGFRFNGKEVFSEGLLEIDGILPALEGADNAERLKIIDDLDLLFSGEDD